MATPKRVRTSRPKYSEYNSLSREWRINMNNTNCALAYVKCTF